MSHVVVNRDIHVTDFQVESFTDGTFMVYAFDNAGNQVNMSYKSIRSCVLIASTVKR